MSLNNIQLTSRQLANLYAGSLVQSESTKTPQPQTVQNYLGGNARRILTVVDHPDVRFLPDAELKFFTNVLSACKLGIADIGIINRQHIKEDELIHLLNTEADTIILLGCSPANVKLPIDFPAFKVQGFAGRKYLHAPSLTAIEAEVPLKKQLWESLRTIFKL